MKAGRFEPMLCAVCCNDFLRGTNWTLDHVFNPTAAGVCVYMCVCMCQERCGLKLKYQTVDATVIDEKLIFYTRLCLFIKVAANLFLSSSRQKSNDITICFSIQNCKKWFAHCKTLHTWSKFERRSSCTERRSSLESALNTYFLFFFFFFCKTVNH